MPTVTHVKRAQKDNAVCKKGESYYHWSFRYGGKHMSLTYPRASQLTGSAFLSEMYSINEEFGDMVEEDYETTEDMQDVLNDFVSRVEEQRDNSDESFNNMPEGLQEGETGQLLEARVEYCEEMVSEIEDAKNLDSVKEILEALENISYQGE